MRSIVSQIHKHRFINRMLTDKTNGRIGYGCGIIIVFRKLRNALQTRKYRFGSIIAAPSRKATVIFLKSPFNRIASIRLGKCSFNGNMPFTAHISVVPIFTKYLCDCRIPVRYLSSVSRTMFIHSSHPAHTYFVLRSTCQQSRPAGATASRIFKLTETYPVFRQKINMWCVYFSAITR